MTNKGNYTTTAALSIHRKGRGVRTICILTVLIIFLISNICGGILSSAHESRSDSLKRSKYYKSIEIQPGDTLWEIAEEYITSDYKSVPEYVRALKAMNSLKTDDIEAGHNLMIAYNYIE